MRIVCFSEIQWRYVRTRKQQVLARFPADWKILFLSTIVRGRPNNLLPKRDGNVVHLCVPVFKNFPQKALRALFSFPPARFLWNVLLLVWVKTVLLLTGFAGRERAFYVSNPYYAAILPFFPRRTMLYDCNDDICSFPGAPGWCPAYFSRLARDADIVTAVSRGLAGKLTRAGAGEVRVIGNGVDFEQFERSASGPPPAELAGMPRPLIGYAGAIAEWFDFDLVARLARRFEEGTVVLIGPVYRSVEERARRLDREAGNVLLAGPRPYEELGGWLAAMDVCIIPLVPNELRRMADPNKLYEYAAVGRPIVTFPYSESIEALKGLVRVARGAEDFVRGVEEAVEKGADGEALKAFAGSRSWQSRADELGSLLEDPAGAAAE